MFVCPCVAAVGQGKRREERPRTRGGCCSPWYHWDRVVLRVVFVANVGLAVAARNIIAVFTITESAAAAMCRQVKVVVQPHFVRPEDPGAVWSSQGSACTSVQCSSQACWSVFWCVQHGVAEWGFCYTDQWPLECIFGSWGVVLRVLLAGWVRTLVIEVVDFPVGLLYASRGLSCARTCIIHLFRQCHCTIYLCASKPISVAGLYYSLKGFELKYTTQ